MSENPPGPPNPTWQLTSVAMDTPTDEETLLDLLTDGWQPYAVTMRGTTVVHHLRLQG